MDHITKGNRDRLKMRQSIEDFDFKFKYRDLQGRNFSTLNIN